MFGQDPYKAFIEKQPSTFGSLASTSRPNLLRLGADISGRDVYFPSRGLSSYVIFAEGRRGADPFLRHVVRHAAKGRRFVLYVAQGRSEHDIAAIRDASIAQDYEFELVTVSEGESYAQAADRVAITMKDIDLGGRFVFLDVQGEHGTDFLEDLMSHLTRIAGHGLGADVTESSSPQLRPGSDPFVYFIVDLPSAKPVFDNMALFSMCRAFAFSIGFVVDAKNVAPETVDHFDAHLMSSVFIGSAAGCRRGPNLRIARDRRQGIISRLLSGSRNVGQFPDKVRDDEVLLRTHASFGEQAIFRLAGA